ncbi:MAG TPA: proline--tRNA ligase [Methanomassiliicoccales archaeon]|jgi:prolyl-tRNA synthetase|nr:proline--tRNA ligase [Methanomassiliicoccales archaeon]MCE5261830.1 proline--tRNA ligase [Euryarchaeota archaeon]HOE53071.1 proline--tRNA ligase [Methanomassiliicoccales archaeon]HOO03375.1 proline--tRNA ligase [Methanomassiliicoccales archaeon]HPD08283.1 proline--tRNA ligase [Methanomassiliicoccales archaeon]
MRKQEDFSEWYNEVVELANLTDKRYPIKGMNVWTPYGWRLMRLIDTFIREECDATGHEEVCFPLLIPETEFKKEKEHIKGFDAEVYWVTHAGLNELDVRLLLRPTSETAMYPIFALWVRSHTDLPLKVYQIVNTFRYETKQTRAFIRVREIHFFESHTCHVDEADAQRQVEEDFVILENLMERLCLPYLLLRRTEWDKFPGAYYTVGVDTLLPDGRSLQLGSIHHYRENFSRPFNITYEDEKGEHRFVHQTTFGMSERLVGAVVAVHGDDKGLVLPPAISPFQVVIVPIPTKGNVERVAEECQRLRAELAAAGLRVKLDDGDERPGSKFNNWEIRGVPLRLELGMRDIEGGKVAYARRDTGGKGALDRSAIVPQVHEVLRAIAVDMRARAATASGAAIQDLDSLDRVPEKVVRFGWCGEEECGHRFEERTGLKMLGTPYLKEEYRGRCVVCGREVDRAAYAARSM